MKPIYSTTKQKEKNFNTKVYIPKQKTYSTSSDEISSKLKKHVKYVNFKRTSPQDQFLYMAELEIANNLANKLHYEVTRKSDNEVISKSSTLKPRVRFKEDELLEDDVCKTQKS